MDGEGGAGGDAGPPAGLKFTQEFKVHLPKGATMEEEYGFGAFSDVTAGSHRGEKFVCPLRLYPPGGAVKITKACTTFYNAAGRLLLHCAGEKHPGLPAPWAKAFAAEEGERYVPPSPPPPPPYHPPLPPSPLK